MSNSTPWKELAEAGGSAHAGHKRGIQPHSVSHRLPLLPTTTNVRAVCVYWPQSMIICGLHVENSSYKPAPRSDYLLSCSDCWGLSPELPPGPARPLAAGSPGWGVSGTVGVTSPAAVGMSSVSTPQAPLRRNPQRARRRGAAVLGVECSPPVTWPQALKLHSGQWPVWKGCSQPDSFRPWYSGYPRRPKMTWFPLVTGNRFKY